MGKPAFDPSKPYEAAAEKKPEFNPDKPFEAVPEKSQAPARSSLTPVESAIAGTEQGVTLGFGDEAIGGLRAAVGKLKGEGDFKDLYPKYRDEQREYNKQAAADNPKAFVAGNVAGSIGTALIPGVGWLSAPAKSGRILATAAKGATIGGIAGAGLSEGNLSTPDKAAELAGDVAGGAAISGTLSGAGQALSNGFKALKPQSLHEYADKRALSAAGFMKKDIKDLSPEQQQQIGRRLLDNKVVTAFSSLEDVAERAGAGKEAAGKAIGNALESVDNNVKELISGIDTGKVLAGASEQQKTAAKKLIGDNFQFNMQRIGDRIQKELVDPNVDNPVIKNELARLSGLAKDFSDKGAKTLGFGNIVKSAQGKSTRFQSETVPELFKQDVYAIIKEELESAVAKTGNLESGLAGLAGKGETLGNASDIAARNGQALAGYKEAKGLYQAMKTAETASKNRLGQTNVNRTFGLTDTIAGAAGLASGGPVQAIALGALNKIGRKYGASWQAVSADTLANGIEAVISKSPELLKRAGPMIEEAAQKGNKTLFTVHLALMKDPEYRSLMADDVDSTPTTPMQRKLDDLKTKQVQGGH